MSRRRTALFSLCCVMSLALWADDGSWSLTGQGRTVIPLQSTQVRMLSETVVIAPNPARPEWSQESEVNLEWCYKWNADCTFRFHNDSAAPADILMGFPDTWEDDSWRWEEAPETGPTKLFAIRGFRCWVAGCEVAVVAKDPDGSMAKDWPDISRVLTWSVHFEPGETKEIRNTYRFGGDSSEFNSGDALDRIDYILRTGALWKGPIGSAEIRVYPGKEWRPGPGIECWNGDWVHLTWRHAVLSPCGFRFDARPEPCFSWSLKNFVPKGDVQVILVKGAMEQLPSPDEGDVADLQHRKTELLAAHGMVFSDPATRAVFERVKVGPKVLRTTCRLVPGDQTGWLFPGDDSLFKSEYAYTLAHWYTPDPAFKVSDLTPCERDYLAALDERIASLERAATVEKK